MPLNPGGARPGGAAPQGPGDLTCQWQQCPPLSVTPWCHGVPRVPPAPCLHSVARPAYTWPGRDRRTCSLSQPGRRLAPSLPSPRPPDSVWAPPSPTPGPPTPSHMLFKVWSVNRHLIFSSTWLRARVFVPNKHGDDLFSLARISWERSAAGRFWASGRQPRLRCRVWLAFLSVTEAPRGHHSTFGKCSAARKGK